MSETHPGNVDEKPGPSARERQLAGLRPIQKGEVRNKTGNNGRTRSEFIAAWLDKPDKEDPGKRPRIEIVLEREYEHTKKSDQACKNLREAYGGKPRQQVDVTSDDEPIAIDVVFTKTPTEPEPEPQAEPTPDDGTATPAG